MSVAVTTLMPIQLTNPDLSDRGKHKVRLKGRVTLTSNEPVWQAGFKYHCRDESWVTVYVAQVYSG
jgi:hypothetical protein